MKVLVSAVAGVFLLAGLVSADQMELKTDKEKLSYSIGMSMGMQLKKQSVDVDMDVFVRGFKDAQSDGKPMMSEQEMQTSLMAFQKDQAAKQTERNKMMGEKNKKEGEAFLAENKSKEGVVTLPSGLQYKILKDGSGKSPQESDSVVVNYRGTLLDGSEFDSSYKRGQPATFPVNGVIKGWTEALKLMKEGSRWQLFVPSDLAYGERGASATIGPNAVLIFEVELLSIKGK